MSNVLIETEMLKDEFRNYKNKNENDKKFESLDELAEKFEEKWHLIESDFYAASVLIDPRYLGQTPELIKNYDNLTEKEKLKWESFDLKEELYAGGTDGLERYFDNRFKNANISDEYDGAWDSVYDIYELFRSRDGVFDRKCRRWRGMFIFLSFLLFFWFMSFYGFLCFCFDTCVLVGCLFFF